MRHTIKNQRGQDPYKEMLKQQLRSTSIALVWANLLKYNILNLTEESYHYTNLF